MWHKRIGLIIVLAGVAVHAGVLGAVAWRSGRVDAYAFHSRDSTEYYAIARNVARHGVFSLDEEPPRTPDTWRTPGYSLFIALCMILLGDSPAVLVVVQQVLCIFNVWLLFKIARGSMSERRAAVVAGLFLLEPYHLFYSLWLMATTLFVTVLLLVWRAWQVATRRRKPIAYGVVGLRIGALILVRPAGVLIPLAVAVAIAVNALGRPRRNNVKGVAAATAVNVSACAVGCLLIVGVWMTRNLVVAGEFALSHQGGIVLAYFKAAEVELWRQGRSADRYVETSLDPARAREPHTVWDAIDVRLRKRFSDRDAQQRANLQWGNLTQGNKTEFDSFEVSAALSRVGWSFLAASPASTVACCLTRCGAVLTFPLNLALTPPSGVEASRVRWIVQALPYLVVCLWVLARCVAGRLRLTLACFPIACVVALLLATTPQLDPRFRVPMIPFLLLLAFLPTSSKTADAPTHSYKASDAESEHQAPL